MKPTALACSAALLLLLAAMQQQYGAQWKVDAEVESAIARGDLSRAVEMAITAEHWRWIMEARSRSSERVGFEEESPGKSLRLVEERSL